MRHNRRRDAAPAGSRYRGLVCLLLAVLAWHGAVGPASAQAGAPAAATGAPVPITSFGAIGDGVADDTAAVQRAITATSKATGSRCLDGGGREYRVRGTLRAAGDFCLINARLRQDVRRFDTRPFIRGACPVNPDPAALIACGDPVIAGQMPAGLSAYLFTRTLLIRPERNDAPIAVTLRNVRIDRGDDPASGARSDAAGLWIGSARKVDLQNVEVTGAGKGFGVMIVDSRNVNVRGLFIHDLVWAPYAGDEPLTLDRIRAQGWNTAPIREFRLAGQQGAAATGFQGVRVQEQISCLMIVRSRDVVLNGLQVNGCRARFAEGDFPWQADGVGIGESSAQIRIGARSVIRDTWEGIDVVGGGSGVSGVAMANVKVVNSFGYGIKIGYATRDVTVTDGSISGAGLAGVVVYGPVRGVAVQRTRISDVGTVRLGAMRLAPWRQERAGVLIEPAHGAEPEGVALQGLRISGSGDCRFGVLTLGRNVVRERGSVVTGCDRAQTGDPRR